MRTLLVANLTLYCHMGAFFSQALQDLGQPHVALDVTHYGQLPGPPILRRVGTRLLGRRLLTYWRYNRDILAAAREFNPEVVLITGGAPVTRSTLRELKARTGAVLVNYATDDPFNPVACAPWVAKNIPLYDLYASTKRDIMDDLRAAGCARVAYVPFAYDPSVHFPHCFESAQESERSSCDVVFIGCADRSYSALFETLLHGIPDLRLNLYGTYWERNPVLARYGRGLALGRDYRVALAGAKIAPCPVRRANRDGLAMRTFESAACGTFVLAERTAEHQEFFREGEEVGYFDSPGELIEKVRYYLAHDDERRRMAEAVHRKVIRGNHTYADRVKQILELAGELISERGRAVRLEPRSEVAISAPGE
jgi:glycosyltransferase involved in cell wall biosynthesis